MDSRTIQMKLPTLKKLKPLKSTSYTNDHINGLDFSDNGSFLMVSTKDTVLDIYNVMTFTKEYSLNINDSGACCPKFFATDLNGLHGATKRNEKSNTFDILHFDLFKLAYRTRFIGCDDEINTIVQIPCSTIFFSTDKKGILNQWDIRINHPTVKLRPVSSSSRVNDYVGVAVESNNVLCLCYENQFYLYDARNLNQFFAQSNISSENVGNVCSMKFSPCEKFVGFMTNENSVHLLDSYDLVEKNKIVVGSKSFPTTSGWDFTPCGRYIVTGNSANGLNLYSCISGELLYNDKKINQNASVNMLFNDNYYAMAVGGDNLSMWAPLL
ncbi:WD40/YVTN repeat-like-containing domain and WD40-repeat-containing domain-containing protein [Strongyloides ratti]|uniref:WD40/YVTN repeat-like-containing domain and WD40-repeat-containing domain-containing protein n=1 Tax=Strongyloides ratti TaxID=34506 RepID=A0A090L018_STRRB|nr:WD40/YVTN repeat-like-containing domain and WD40-repeat-containing domain-containing protein [Strongyloides ratti]CEF63026.1 WD40/YVTN repeat-like-containing domain and WD40-repeat-containing domain-containing protein [Strongyloides ratti]